MKPAIRIGVKRKAVKEVRRAILAILATPTDTEAKVAACDALVKATSVSNTTIQNCTFAGK